MQSVQNFVQKNLFSLLLLVTAGGFAMLLAELMLMGHTAGDQQIGAIAAAIGLLLALVGMVAKGNLRYLLVVLFLVLSVSGIYGTIEHAEGREHRAEEIHGLTITVTGDEHHEADEKEEAEHSSKVASDEEEEEEEAEEIGEELLEEFTEFPPMLSPLALSGFAALGAVVLLGKKEDKWAV